MKNNMNIIELKKEELILICGGHKGFFYKAGVLYMEITLTGLGILAGMWEGITE